MKWMSERLTEYVVKSGVVPEDLYAVYQYGFQIGLEMIFCFLVCFAIAIYLHIIPEFIVFSIIFMLFRTYAGGLHLNSFGSCFICSIVTQTLVTFVSTQYNFKMGTAWFIIAISSVLIYKLAPVESISKTLDEDEKRHCKKVTMKIVICTILFAGCSSIACFNNVVSLVAMTILLVLLSQCMGIIKYKNYKKNELKTPVR